MIVPVSSADIRFVRDAWAFAEDRGAEISAHWRDVCAENPDLYNGRVLKARNCRVEGGVFRAEAIETDFASFLYWRDSGFPDHSMKNLFGTAAVWSSEQDLILGRMSSWTANAGLIYPFGGSLGPEDVSGDQVDMSASTARELAEESGLDINEAIVTPGFLAIFDGPRVALLTTLTFPLSTSDLVARIEAFLASERKPELDGVHVVRSLADLLPERMPPYTQSYIRHVYGS